MGLRYHHLSAEERGAIMVGLSLGHMHGKWLVRWGARPARFRASWTDWPPQGLRSDQSRDTP